MRKAKSHFRFALRCILCSVCGIVATMPTAAHADQAKLHAIFRQVGVWDTNPLMRAHSRENIYGSTSSPEIAFLKTTDNMEAKANLSVDHNVFNTTSFNSTDIHARTNLRRMNERWEVGTKAQINHDTTRTSELSNFGINVGSIKHFSYQIEPDLIYIPTSRDRLSLATSFARHTYDSDAYTNYELYSLTPSLTRSLTPLTAGILSFQAQRYQSRENLKKRTDSIGPTIGFESNLTPKVTLNAQTGAQASKQSYKGLPNEEWKWHYIFAAGLTFDGDADLLNLSATRARQPFGSGTDSLLTTFSIDNKHDINEQLTLSYGASYKFADYDTDPESNLDYLISGQSGLSYHMTKTLDLTASYQYKYEKLTKTFGKANQSIAHVGINYRFNWDDIEQ